MHRFFLSFILFAVSLFVFGQPKSYNKYKSGSFPLIRKQQVPNILIDKKDAKVVSIAATMLAGDMEMVSGCSPSVLTEPENNHTVLIIAGTVGQSDWIDQMVTSKKLDVENLKGKWESWQTQVVKNPLKGVKQALVIVGSDRRGTAYGLLEISRLMGVSPWVWWADVIPEKKSDLYISKGIYNSTEPSVKYRGIFLNDEDWGLKPWAAKKMDTDIKDIGPKTYAKIFELMLRLRSNYIWPAMHDCTKAFYYYPENPKVADDYAIVVGSSHCEPVLRNNVFEWTENFRNEYGMEPGEWRYDLNQQQIYTYWNDRAKQSSKYESVYTVGMSGIHDGKMPGPKDSGLKIKLLEKVIANQREILGLAKNENISKIPQIFCPYKEVLSLYEKGLNLPEDITIVWPDDNFGYIRQLSNTEEQKRSGGSGVYYHLSYWGKPYDYLWLSTTSPSLIAYEMNKAYQFGARKVWIFNVGDIKPAEMEIEFAMDMAWDVTKWTPENAYKYNVEWAACTFGSKYSKSIAVIKKEFYNLSQSAKPEHLTKVSFTPEEEKFRLLAYNDISNAADSLYKIIPDRLKDAFFQLIWYPVQGAALMNQKFIYAHQSIELAKSQSPEALKLADKSTDSYTRIQNITYQYNTEISKGKWNGIMSSFPRNLDVFKMPTIADSQMLLDSVVYIGENEPEKKSEFVLSISKDAKLKNTDSESLIICNGLGKGGCGITRKSFTGAVYPENCTKAPYIEFDVKLNAGNTDFIVYALPTQPLTPDTGVRYAISVNDSEPEIVDLKAEVETPQWSKNVINGFAKGKSSYMLSNEKSTNVKIYLIEPGVVINQVVVSQ